MLGDYAFLMTGDIAAARHHIETAIQIAADEANDLLHARCTVDLANLAFVTGSLDEASDRIQQVLDGPAGSVPVVEMHAQAVLGKIHYDRGAYADARERRPGPWRLPSPRTIRGLPSRAHLDLAAIECAAGAVEDSAAHIATAENLNPETAHGSDPRS